MFFLAGVSECIIKTSTNTNEIGDSSNRLSTKIQICSDYVCMLGTAAKGTCLSIIYTSPLVVVTVAGLLVLKLFRVRHIQDLQLQY